MSGGQLISVQPEELIFEVEPEKPAFCNLRIINNSEQHIAFKVKTTSPKKYFVRPNTSVVQPWDSCTITVTLQAQKEFPPDMQCKDKFLIQSTKVSSSIDMDEIPPDTVRMVVFVEIDVPDSSYKTGSIREVCTLLISIFKALFSGNVGFFVNTIPRMQFNKDEEKVIEECKLRVVYIITPQSGNANSVGESGVISAATHSMSGSDRFMNSTAEEGHTLQRLREERDSTLQQNKQLQRELETLKRHRSHASNVGFSLTFAAITGLVGLLVGIILKFALSTTPSSA